MLRFSKTILVPVLGLGVGIAVQSLFAASDPNWPFQLLPKPASQSNGPVAIPASNSTELFLSAPGLTKLATGDYVADRDLTIKLKQTEGKSFTLSGEVWLDGPSPRMRYPTDAPAGFGLYLREIDGLHRYQASSSLLRVKRRLLGGVLQKSIVHVAALPDPTLHTWIGFTLVATPEQIHFSFGGNEGEIRGPLNTDGSNVIALVAGTHLRNVRLEVVH